MKLFAIAALPGLLLLIGQVSGQRLAEAMQRNDITELHLIPCVKSGRTYSNIAKALETMRRYSPAAACFCLCLLLCGCNAQEKKPENKSTIRALDKEHQADTDIKPSAKTDAARVQGDSPRSDSNDEDTTVPGLTVTGHVRLKGGAPATSAVLTLLKVPAAEMFLTHWPAETFLANTVTDRNGYYSIRCEDERLVVLRVAHEGSATQQSLVGNQTWGYTASAPRSAVRDFVLSAEAPIRGKVVDEDNKPVGNVALTALGDIPGFAKTMRAPSVTTSTQDGTFTLSGVEPGRIQIMAHAEDYVPATVTATAPSEHVEIRLNSHGSALEGTVRLFDSAQGVSSATVSLVPTVMPGDIATTLPKRHTVTSGDGTFRLTHLAPGTYQVEAKATDLGLIPLDQKDAYRIRLMPQETTGGLVLQMYGGHTVRGTVREKTTSAPLAGALVRHRNAQAFPPQDDEDLHAVHSGPDGMFEITRVTAPTGKPQLLEAVLEGYSLSTDKPGPFSLRMDRLVIEQDLELSRNSTVSGIVKTPAGEGVSGAWVSLSRGYTQVGEVESNFGPGRVKTDREGRYTITVLPLQFQWLYIKAKAEGFPLAFSEMISPGDRPTTGVDIVLTIAGPVSGRVVNEQQEGVAGAKVRLSHKLSGHGNTGIAEVESGAEGRFTSPLICAGTMALNAGLAGYARSRTETFDLQPGEQREVTLILQKGHSITGKVMNQAGEPVPNTSLNASVESVSSDGWGSGQGTTDDQGYYEIKDLRAGSYTVQASHSMYRQRPHKSGVQTGQTNVDFVLGNKVTAQKFIGHLVDGKLGTPVTDYSVISLNDAVVEKDSSRPGTFIARDLPNWDPYFRFKITATGYPERNYQAQTTDESKEVVEEQIRLYTAGGFQGRVVRKTGWTPLAGANVRLHGTNDLSGQGQPLRTTVTADDGTFRMEDLPEGRCYLFADAEPGLKSGRREAYVASGEMVDLGELVVAGAGIFTVRVVTGSNDAPVAGERVTLSGSGVQVSKSASTDAQGIARFDGLSPASYNIQCRNAASRLYIPGEQDREIVIHIGSATIHGRVLLEGKPLQNASYLSIYATDGTVSFSPQMLDEARFELSGISAGKWTVAAHYNEGNAGRRVTKEVEVGDDGDTEVILEFETPSRIVGVVHDAQGSPVSAATVSVTPSDASGKPTQTFTSGDGSFSIATGSGPVGILASKAGVGTSPPKTVEVPNRGDAERIVLQLLPGDSVLKVNVLDYSTGKPMPSARMGILSPTHGYLSSASADPSGILNVDHLPAGKYKITVSASGYTSQEHAIELIAGETLELHDVLHPAGMFTWILEDHRGRRLGDVNVKLLPTDPNSLQDGLEKKTSSDGIVAFTAIPGEYSITAQPTGFQPISVPIRIINGFPGDLTTRAQPTVPK